MPGSTLGSYRVERLLGRGGMGAVFLAYDTTLRRQVALKRVEGTDDAGSSRARLLREARSAAALNHPNICTIHEVGAAGGRAFIAMEYVEGRSLRDRLDEGALAPQDATRYALQAAEALAYAGPTLADLFSAILRDAPPPMPAGVPPALRGIIDRCLAKEPERRYQSAGEMRAALEAAASDGEAPARRGKRRVFLAAAAAAAGAAVVLAVAGGARGWWRALMPDPPAIRLAVLPFRNLTNDPSQDLFSDGLTEETITALGKLRSARLSFAAPSSCAPTTRRPAHFMRTTC